ncbi:MAG: DUF937 domain-containing protein [Granulosicoccus sp.]
MSFNIVDLVKDQVGDNLIGVLSKTLGADTDQTNTAVAGALPSLLSGITSAASTPRGAVDLFNAAQEQDNNMLGDIGNLLGGDSAHEISKTGNSLLSNLLGEGALGQLAGVIENVAGVSRGNSNSLLGMLAPIIVGVIKNKIKESGLNAGSLSNLLSDQKDNINAAMPQGISDQLQSAGFFDSITPDALASTNTSTVSAAPNPATTPAASPVPLATTEKSRGGIMKWALSLVAILGLGWFGMQYMNQQAADKATAQAEAAVQAAADQAAAVKRQAEEAKQQAADALSAAQEAMPAGVDLGKISGGLEGVFGSAGDALSGITDLESAKSAIPSLEDAAGKLGGLNDIIVRLPDAAKGPLAAIVQNGIGTIQPLIDKVSAIPGVGAIIEPVIAPIVEMLNGLAG